METDRYFLSSVGISEREAKRAAKKNGIAVLILGSGDLRFYTKNGKKVTKKTIRKVK